MILEPDRYPQTAVYELLAAASRGEIGVDRPFLDAILNRIDAAVPDLVRFGLEGHEDAPVPLDVDLVAIFRSHPDPRALPFLIECVRRSSQEVEDDVLEAICRQEQAAVEPLIALYDELGAERSGEVAFLLAGLGVRDPRILQILLDRLALDPGDAAFCLGVYGDPAAKPALEAMLEKSEDAREAREAILRLENPEPRTAAEPPDIRTDYPERQPPRFDLFSSGKVLGYLKSLDPDYRAGAAGSFRSRKLEGEARTVLFDLAQSDPVPRVRANCWEALSAAADDVNIRKTMLTRLGDAEAPLEERCGALIGLAEHAGDPTVRRWILNLYEKPDARAKALEAMWRSLDRRFAEYFPRHLDDSDQDVKREAIAGVGYLGIGSQSGRLMEFFEDEDFRADALYSYALAAPGEVSRIRMRQLLNRIDELAGGLSRTEQVLVETALDDRLAMHGLKPVFVADEEDQPGAENSPKPGRNETCPCGSGKKYKKCCGR